MQARPLTPFGPAANFYECPRWRDGRWWVSDMRGGTVYSFSPEGEARTEFTVDDRPGGIGWTRDGRLLVVSMEARRLLQVAPGGRVEKTIELASLIGDTAGICNDMAVSPRGHAYIGFDADHVRYSPDADLGLILHVTPEGQASVAARGLAFPNGLVFTPDGTRLVAAETMRPRFTSFAIGADGGLGDRKVWGELSRDKDTRASRTPAFGERSINLDGCGMDAEGHIWAADCGSTCLRIAPGGAVVDSVTLPDGMRPFACGLGGPDGRTLMICASDEDAGVRAATRSSRLFTTTVDVPAP
jgi:sugar lactone lactonase YvrE